MARRGIPQYFLYGEATHDVDERFLHIESIAERSRLHDWQIRPHAHQDLQHLVLVTRGSGIFHAEGAENTFAQTAFISVPLACVHGFDFKPGTDGWVLTASGALLERIGRDHTELRSVLAEPTAMALSADAYASMLAFAEGTLGLTPLNNTDATAYNYSNAFDYTQPPLLAPLRPTVTHISRSERLKVRRFADYVENDPT